MKLSILVLGILFVFATPKVFANEENFEKRKAEILAEIDEHLKKGQEHRGCIASASDHEAMKKCHESMKSWRHGERMEHMEKRKGRLEERMQKMKEKSK